MLQIVSLRSNKKCCFQQVFCVILISEMMVQTAGTYLKDAFRFIRQYTESDLELTWYGRGHRPVIGCF